MSKKVMIVGGVAGGMSCAARLRRMDEDVEITVFERGPDVSFANCGMPYYIGGIIPNRQDLQIQTAQGFENRFGVKVLSRHEVTGIDRGAKTITVKNLESGESVIEGYDTLVLATGASPIRPPIPGVDGPNVHILNNLTDMDGITGAASRSGRGCVVGAGFIGLELVENLRERGLEVVLVEMLDQVMPPLDWEMTQPLLQELRLHGVEVHLGETVSEISQGTVTLKSGVTITSDFVCMCAGVAPNSALARDAGLEIGPKGHIKVDTSGKTSDPDIFAVGDVVETVDFVTGNPTAVPLAGPANRQGRIAADVIAGREAAYRATQGTSIVKVFGLAAACTGLNEKRLNQLALPYHRVFVHPTQHPRYYPGAAPVAIKVLFSPEGKLYGAQVVGNDGVEVLIDILATALRANMTVEDLEHLELAYSPQWGGAKHGINMAGFVAANVLRGDVTLIEPDDEDTDGVFWLDVRTLAEAECGVLPGATVIPVDELRKRVGELPKDKPIAVYCAVGLRGYVAYRFLTQAGFDVRNLNGGYRTWSFYRMNKAGLPTCPKTQSQSSATASPPAPTDSAKLDCRGLQCPGPLVRVKDTMTSMKPGEILEVTATDPGFVADIPAWCRRTGNTLLGVSAKDGNYIARLQRVAEKAAEVQTVTTGGNKKTFVCFSCDLDKVLATFVIANGAAAMGNEVTIFFTFWGLNVLRKENPPSVSKGFLDKMFGMMMPKGPNKLKLSKMNMGGMGTLMMKHVMKTKNVISLPDLIGMAKASRVKFVACSMSMDVMGIKAEELIDGVEIAGVGNFLGEADDSNVTMFI